MTKRSIEVGEILVREKSLLKKRLKTNIPANDEKKISWRKRFIGELILYRTMNPTTINSKVAVVEISVGDRRKIVPQITSAPTINISVTPPGIAFPNILSKKLP